jgi:Sec-independent protein secretion pathway component TatC
MFHNLIVEIRNRISIVLTTWISIFFISYKYKEILLFSLLQLNKNINYLIVTNITEVFLIYFKLNLFLADYFFIFYFGYHFFLFFVPGLYYAEYMFLKNLFLIGLINLICSIFFIIWIGVPITWAYFFKYQQIVSNQIIPLYFEIKLEEFLVFYTSFLHLSILSAFFSTTLIFFSMFINKNLFLLKINRKAFHLNLLIISIFLTPPDIFSFFLVGFVLMLIFELFIFFNFLRI